MNIQGTSASLGPPQSVATDAAGNVFFVAQHAVLRLDAITGILTAVAGNGTRGFSGDNGPATSAQLNFPQGLAFDSAGNLYIADVGNNRIRKVSNGAITTVAGNGTQAFRGDNGLAINAQLNTPAGVAVDSAGNLYIVDDYNQRVRKVSNGVITTLAGNGVAGWARGDRPEPRSLPRTPARGFAGLLRGRTVPAGRRDAGVRHDFRQGASPKPFPCNAAVCETVE